MSVQAVETFSPYSNVVSQFTQGIPTWMNAMDAERIWSYQVYEQIYWNVPDTFKVVLRGTENAQPIYVPTARTIVDTTNRYLCPQPAFLMDPDVGSDTERESARRAFSSLFRRERFWSKFQANKMYGVIRGDWMWHILANPAKPPGRRIKIEPLDPAAYFPVYHPDDPDRLIAVYIVEQVVDPEDNKTYIRRQTYTKGEDPVENDGSDTTIWNSEALFDVEKWEDINGSAVRMIQEPAPLPPEITAIPVYHIPNIVTPGDPFGSSELRGFERVFAAINQAVSDEELALALEGLGMYATTGGPPRDERGNITDWLLGPGRVVEHQGEFKRINGVNSVAPVQDHLKFLINSIKEASGASDAATGKVDVTVAESGIALQMQLAPMLAKVDMRKDSVEDVHAQMFYDLRQWFIAYEQTPLNALVLPVFGSAVPTDVKGEIDKILTIYNAGLADDDWARGQLEDLGYDFGDGMGEKVRNELSARARATDPFGTRMDSEDDLNEDES